jgi:hypothetical protein
MVKLLEPGEYMRRAGAGNLSHGVLVSMKIVSMKIALMG